MRVAAYCRQPPFCPLIGWRLSRCLDISSDAPMLERRSPTELIPEAALHRGSGRSCPSPSAVGRCTRGLGRAFLHLLPQAQGAHVRPNFLHVDQTLGLRAGLPGVAPAERVLAVSRPDGVLLLMVHNDLVDGRVFFLILTHVVFPPCDRATFHAALRRCSPG